MGGLFSKPKTPPPTPMPDELDPANVEAKKKRIFERSASGRAGTMLSGGASSMLSGGGLNIGDTFDNSKVG